MFKLRFPKSEVSKWDGTFTSSTAACVRSRGYLRRDEFLAVCKWKTPRSQPRCARNQPNCVARITRVALSPGTPDRLKIQVLTELSGVGWPTASVILHFFDRDPFPILDYRALWSVGQDAPAKYTYDFWHEYTRFTRGLAMKVGCDMRTLDRALWQYSKDNQDRAPRK